MDDMQAGRELDALIAEKVMGWHSEPNNYYWLDTENKPMRLKWYDSDAWDECWSPSTDIADAWQVVEKISSYSLTVIITNHMAAEGWNVEILGLEEDIGADAATAPLAICLAAQKMANLRL